MILNAYAKINLTLDIISKRADGFHELESVMVPVSLCDRVELAPSETFGFFCDQPELSGDDNLCVRAAKAYLEASGLKESVTIKLTKSIPVAAGLGGGSSDAAAVLRGMDLLYKKLEEKTLFELAADLGSDVSFCLLSRCALCTGRGERMSPMELPHSLWLVIAIGNGRISAKEAYKTYDEQGITSKRYTKGLVSAISSGETELCTYFGNDFEPICVSMCPETKDVLTSLKSAGAKASLVSGSGPACYGVFGSEEEAKKAANALNKKGFSAFFCRSI